MNNTLKKEIYPIKTVSPPKVGKVRTVYDVGDDSLILISSDDLSTHDVVHKRQVYAKGDNLNEISSYYFENTRHIVPNHFIGTIGQNSWLVGKAERINIEFVFRQYLTGFGWKAYVKAGGPERGMEFCGAFLRPGYRKNEKLDQIMFTPSAKGQAKDFSIPEFSGLTPEEAGEEDPKITPDIIRKNYKAFNLRKAEDLDYITEKCFELFSFMNSDIAPKGKRIADTKWELGYFPDGDIGLIDESLTPDSSRFWENDSYLLDEAKNEFIVVQKDKQHFRDHVESLGLDKDKKALAEYLMPDEILRKGVVIYCDIREAITGTLPVITAEPVKKILLESLASEGYLK